MSKPSIDPVVVATLTEAAPARIQKKLEAEPRLAEAWQWTFSELNVEIDTGSEKVTLSVGSTGAIGAPELVACTCLLGPRCLHVLAVIHSLPLGNAFSEAPTQEDTTSAHQNDANGAQDTTPTQDSLPLQVSDDARRAARTMLHATGRLLERGAARASLSVANELLRAVHTARIEGLHRMAAAGLRVAESIRMHREGSPGFDRDQLLIEFRELVTVAHTLSLPEVDARGFVGTARRQYRDVGSLKLSGVLVDPVTTKTGYAGVVTYFVDAQGTFWTLSDVAPGNASRAIGAYDGGASIGDVKAAPRLLCRQGILLQGATGSDDGRLGSGKAVKAVTVKPTAVHEWSVWKTPIDDQIARSLAAASQVERRAGDDMVFVEAEVAGVSGENLVVVEVVTERPLSLRAPNVSKNLKFVANLKLLGRAPGLRALFVARRAEDTRDGLNVLAIFPSPDAEKTVKLPDEFGGRCNLGLDTLKPEYLGALERQPVELTLAERPRDPLHAMRQRVASVVQGGRFVFHAGAAQAAKRDAARLNAQFMHAGADLLSQLIESAEYVERDFSGKIQRTDPTQFALAWCAAAAYLEAAEVELARAGLL